MAGTLVSKFNGSFHTGGIFEFGSVTLASDTGTATFTTYMGSQARVFVSPVAAPTIGPYASISGNTVTITGDVNATVNFWIVGFN